MLRYAPLPSLSQARERFLDKAKFPNSFAGDVDPKTAAFMARAPKRITPAQRELVESMYRNAGLELDDAGGALGGTVAEPTSWPTALTRWAC